MLTKLKKLANLVVIACLTITATIISVPAKTTALSSKQWDRADRMAKVAMDTWEEYGVLPSLVCGQAMEETTMGLYGRGPSNNNFWGMGATGKGVVGRCYSSLEEGARDYCRNIRYSGYYKGASFIRDYEDQIRKIGHIYCPTNSSYAETVIGLIRKYGFDKYDRILFKKLEKKKQAEERRKKLLAEKRRQQKLAEQKKKELEARKAAQSQLFTIKYDPTIAPNSIGCNAKIIPQGSVSLVQNGAMVPETYIYNAQAYNTQETNVLYLNDRRLEGMKVYLSVREDAVG